ncbi:MAG TPA: sigma-70 family RNA polymerase sigma factor [Thermoguttaceae bacterium]|nr:sigma-70 family RNA polymerase sigma factor [Thermoguttaceae bacterium]
MARKRLKLEFGPVASMAAAGEYCSFELDGPTLAEVTEKVEAQERGAEHVDQRRQLQMQFSDGSADALAELMELYGEALLSIARRLVGETLTDDLLQDLFLRLQAEAGRYDPNRNWFSWARFILKNLGIDVLRREARFSSLSDAAQVPDLDHERTDVIEVHDALNQLDAHARKVLELRFYGKRTLEEIATTLGVSKSTAKRYVDDALWELRRFLVL